MESMWRTRARNQCGWLTRAMVAVLQASADNDCYIFRKVGRSRQSLRGDDGRLYTSEIEQVRVFLFGI